MTAAELLKSIRSLVAYHQSCGINYYHNSGTLEAGLRQLERVAADPEGEGQNLERQGLSTSTPVIPQSEPDTVTIAELTEEIKSCKLCQLNETRQISTSGNGGMQPDLLVVGDWLVHNPATHGESLFGDQQDLMLTKMIGAIEMKQSEVFVTNLIKCSVAESCRPEASQITTCMSYLKQQITLLSPRVILTMGSAVSQALLDTTRPLIALRGRFHPFQFGSGQTIPLMPTFHPSYLLKNPEMKQPTWNDLQMVRKKLGEAPARQ
ncbi:MAG: uracil-DNA glycosylase [Desulfocapsaceae bacterium]